MPVWPIGMSTVLTRNMPLALGAALLVLRVPYLFAGHIQEDAFITWRVARVLIESGTYGFNPGEVVSASSSHAYLLLCAILRFGSGEGFIPVVLIFNSMLLVAATGLLSGIILPEPTHRRLLWGMVSVTPVALQISYSGMETSLLVFLLAVLLADYARHDTPSPVGLCAVAILPWVRPDAIVWPLVGAMAFATKNRSFLFRTVLVTAASTILVSAFNYAYFGSFVNQTVIAKRLAYHPAFGLSDVLSSLQEVFLGNRSSNSPGAFVPVYSRYFVSLGPVALVVVIGATAYWLWRSRTDPIRREVLVSLAGWVFVPPVAYAIGGVVFPWYMWPSKLLGTALVIGAVLDRAGGRSPAVRNRVIRALGIGLTMMALAEWTLAFHWGDSQGRFLTEIGLNLRGMSRPGNTLLLEPAGYIPYFSGIHTDDEIGLVSPKVTSYMRRDGKAWWIHFVKQERPTFLVERAHMLKYATHGGYQLSADEQRWFIANYSLVRTFTYDPSRYHDARLLVHLLRRVSPEPQALHLYRVRGEAPPAAAH